MGRDRAIIAGTYAGEAVAPHRGAIWMVVVVTLSSYRQVSPSGDARGRAASCVPRQKCILFPRVDTRVSLLRRGARQVDVLHDVSGRKVSAQHFSVDEGHGTARDQSTGRSSTGPPCGVRLSGTRWIKSLRSCRSAPHPFVEACLRGTSYALHLRVPRTGGAKQTSRLIRETGWLAPKSPCASLSSLRPAGGEVD